MRAKLHKNNSKIHWKPEKNEEKGYLPAQQIHHVYPIWCQLIQFVANLSIFMTSKIYTIELGLPLNQ